MNWQKMQQQFMQEKTKKGPNGPGTHVMGPRGPMMGPGGMMDLRMMGPPPPYPHGQSQSWISSLFQNAWP